MDTIPFPNNLKNEFYDVTIFENPNIVLDGYYFGPFNKKYKQSRKELNHSLKLIFICDYWLDGHYFHDDRSNYHVPDTMVLGMIEKYYDITIPLGCLAIAVKHRKEVHAMAPDGNGFDLIFKKKAYFNYLKQYEK